MLDEIICYVIYQIEQDVFAQPVTLHFLFMDRIEYRLSI